MSPMQIPAEVLQLARWDQLDHAGAESVARALEQRLPMPWRLRCVHEHEAGSQKRSVAFFDWRGAEFALIPGGPVLLGHDPSQMPDVTEKDLEDWENAKSAYGDL